MNHDYGHCLDCKDDCPDDCFRAQITRDLKNYPGMPVTFFTFYGTDECKMTRTIKIPNRTYSKVVQLAELTPECIDKIVESVVNEIRNSADKYVLVTKVDDGKREAAVMTRMLNEVSDGN